MQKTLLMAGDRLNEKKGLPKIGLRSIKTAVSATLCAIIYVIIGRNATFACIGAVFGMESENSDKPWRTGGNRMVGTILGGFLGMGLFYLHAQQPGRLYKIALLLVGIILLIYLSQLLGCPGAIQGGAVVFYIVMLNTPHEQYISYALNRMLDTAVGVGMSLLVNLATLHSRQNGNVS